MPPAWLNGVRLYNGFVDGIYRLAYEVTKVIQGGPMGPQIAVSLLAAVAVMGAALWVLGNPVQLINLGGAWPHGEELIIFVLAIIAAFATLIARSRLSAIISIGVVGVSVTLFFVIFSAPDLALTQLLIEVLTVVLLVLVFFRVQPDRLPAYSVGRRTVNIAIAVLMGLFGAAVVAFNNSFQVAPSISDYFLQNAYAIGKGANVVNVILVDTRGYDTLGEITVLGLAALGGYAIMRSPQLHSLRNRLNVARERLAAANTPGRAGAAKPNTGKPITGKPNAGTASNRKAGPENPTHD
jgi:multicomponent Na+:H+ antiporter subunit A